MFFVFSIVILLVIFDVHAKLIIYKVIELKIFFFSKLYAHLVGKRIDKWKI